MSTFSTSMGCLMMVATSVVAGADYSPEINAQGANMTMTANNEQPTKLPHPPLKIPMPLDKAGYKVDVTFEVPPLPKGITSLNYFIGLRVMFAPGTDEVFDALEENPVTARIFLYRIADRKELKIPLFNSKIISDFGEYPYRFEVFEIPEGKATAELTHASHSGAPRGTPDASTLVFSFTAAKDDGTPGVYRLQVETLEDIPALSGITSFLVYEERRKR